MAYFYIVLENDDRTICLNENFESYENAEKWMEENLKGPSGYCELNGDVFPSVKIKGGDAT